jgi:hypothetical protein
MLIMTYEFEYEGSIRQRKEDLFTIILSHFRVPFNIENKTTKKEIRNKSGGWGFRQKNVDRFCLK